MHDAEYQATNTMYDLHTAERGVQAGERRCHMRPDEALVDLEWEVGGREGGRMMVGGRRNE